MQGIKRFRFRERGRATPTLHGAKCMVALIWAFFLPGAVPVMAQEPVRTEPVVVTATRIEEKVSEQASSVSVVTREDMERKSPSLAGDVLQGSPGSMSSGPEVSGAWRISRSAGGKAPTPW